MSSPQPGPVLSSSPLWMTKRGRGVCGPYAKTGRWKQGSHRPLEVQLCHQPLSPDLSELSSRDLGSEERLNHCSVWKIYTFKPGG